GFPVNALLFRPMLVQLGQFFVAFRSKRGMPISDYRFALLLAIGNNSNFDFVSGEPRRHNNVRHLALFHVIGGEQQKSFYPIAADGRKQDTFALGAFSRMNEMGAQVGDQSTSRTGPKSGVTSATDPFNKIVKD